MGGRADRLQPALADAPAAVGVRGPGARPAWQGPRTVARGPDVRSYYALRLGSRMNPLVEPKPSSPKRSSIFRPTLDFGTSKTAVTVLSAPGLIDSRLDSVSALSLWIEYAISPSVDGEILVPPILRLARSLTPTRSADSFRYEWHSPDARQRQAPNALHRPAT